MRIKGGRRDSSKKLGDKEFFEKKRGENGSFERLLEKARKGPQKDHFLLSYLKISDTPVFFNKTQLSEYNHSRGIHSKL